MGSVLRRAGLLLNRKPYPSDVPDEEWGLLAPYLTLLHEDDRELVGREACPTSCVLNAQAARSGGVWMAGECGYDPAGQVVGRRRLALPNTEGGLLVAGASPADLQDSHSANALPRASRGQLPFLAHCFAYSAYRGEHVGAATITTVEIVEPH